MNEMVAEINVRPLKPKKFTSAEAREEVADDESSPSNGLILELRQEYTGLLLIQVSGITFTLSGPFCILSGVCRDIAPFYRIL